MRAQPRVRAQLSPTHASNSIIKFADDATVVGQITNNDETAYREEVRALAERCQENNLSLNVNKTKELIMDFRKQQREHAPIHIDGTAVEKVKSFSLPNASHQKCTTIVSTDYFILPLYHNSSGSEVYIHKVDCAFNSLENSRKGCHGFRSF